MSAQQRIKKSSGTIVIGMLIVLIQLGVSYAHVIVDIQEMEQIAQVKSIFYMLMAFF